MIEGIPDGWELVRVGKPLVDEYYIDVTGSIYKALDTTPTVLHWYMPIIRKIEKPKQYRPFANAAEFAPHRDRWIRRLANGGAFLVSDYSNEGFCYDELNPVSWEELFNMGYVFDNPDGTTDPFGVEVQS